MKAFILSSYRHPIAYLGTFLLIGLLAFFLAKKITLDADISALLPDSFESVTDLKQVKEWFGGIGYVVVVGSGASPDKLRQFSDEVARVTRDIEEVSYVDYKRSIDFFRNKALYYLDTHDLNTIEKRIKKRYKWEKNSRNPMYIDLEGGEPPSLDFHDLQDKYKSESSSWMSSQQTDEAYYFDASRELIAVFIKPNMTAADLDFSKMIIDKIKTRLASIDYSVYGPDFKSEITGRYQKQIDLQKQMKTDLSVASSVALVLVVLYLLIHFRRIEALALIMAPLILGLLLTFAFAQLTFGQLNILTAFIGVILLGLGIDHGIHLLSRYLDEHRRGIREEEAVTNTFTQTGRAVAVAALTTFVSFLGLSFSEFRAFFEFGLIASVGMFLITAAYLLVMPPMLKIATQFTWNMDSIAYRPRLINTFADILYKHRLKFLSVGLLVGMILSAFGSYSSFNYDFDSLAGSNIRSFVLDKQVNELLGYSQTPMVALTHDREQERFISQQLAEHKNNPQHPSGIDFTLATTDLVPLDQQDKQRSIKKIEKILKKVNPSWLKQDDLEKLEQMKEMVLAAPFDYQALPEEVRLMFGGEKSQQADENGVVMLFPAIKLSDGEKVIDLANEIRSVHQQDGQRLVVAGEAMILADILKLVFSESPKVFTICGLLILAILWFFMRSLYLAFICLVPAIFTLSTTLGVMALFNIEFNYINILMFPVLLGISVDSGVHMVNRALEGEDMHSIVSETGTAIFGSILTSGLGLGALLLTDHNGLNSLAQIGTIGLFINLLVSLLVFPALLSLKKMTGNKEDQTHNSITPETI